MAPVVEVDAAVAGGGSVAMTDPATWPAYCGSMAQAAALMGIPKGVLRMAKARGAPGFIDSRVRPKLVAEWLEKNNPAAVAPPSSAEAP
ncbi:MAG: hypothetical protein RL153_226, partial [Verrucomicrobiota bacterium]